MVAVVDEDTQACSNVPSMERDHAAQVVRVGDAAGALLEAARRSHRGCMQRLPHCRVVQPHGQLPVVQAGRVLAQLLAQQVCPVPNNLALHDPAAQRPGWPPPLRLLQVGPAVA